jgi:hypothetical protein
LQGLKGDTGATGDTGPLGATGATGATGPAGTAATIAIGSVTTGNASTNANVVNRGSTSAAIFDCVLPRGADGAPGTNGTNGSDATNLANPAIYKWANSLPTAPTGSSTYTWATGAISGTIPSGWYKYVDLPASPGAGYALYSASATVKATSSATSPTITVDWSTAVVKAIGYNGTNGVGIDSVAITNGVLNVTYNNGVTSAVNGWKKVTVSNVAPPSGDGAVGDIWYQTY